MVRQQREPCFTPDEASWSLEAEAQPLKDRCQPHPRGADVAVTSGGESATAKVARIHEQCAGFGNLDVGNSKLQEEQERELSPEIQQERQMERPREAEPQTHRLQKHVKRFVDTGEIIKSSNAYMSALAAFMDTRLTSKYPIVSEIGDCSLPVTKDFVRTIVAEGTSAGMDAYQEYQSYQEEPKRQPSEEGSVVFSTYRYTGGAVNGGRRGTCESAGLGN